MEYETISGDEVQARDARRQDRAQAGRRRPRDPTGSAVPSAGGRFRPPAAPAAWSRSRSPDPQPLYRGRANALDAAAGQPRGRFALGSRNNAALDLRAADRPFSRARRRGRGRLERPAARRAAAALHRHRDRHAEGARVDRRIVSLGDAIERDWGRGTLHAAQDLEAITAPRARLAGLALDRPRIMGIVNVTPDSFSDGGLHASTQAAIAHGLKLAEEGADILDIGGESTRPGADYVPAEEELRRVIPVIEGLRARTDALISIDTRKAEVMRRAAAAGADILNDVSALTHDPEALRVAAESGLPVILMHAQGDPRTMNDNPQYSDVALDVFDYLESASPPARRPASRGRRSSPIPASASASTCTTTSP